MDWTGAFSGGGGYDFGGSSSASGGTNTVNYKSGSTGVSPMLLLGVAAIAAIVLLKR